MDILALDTQNEATLWCVILRTALRALFASAVQEGLDLEPDWVDLGARKGAPVASKIAARLAQNRGLLMKFMLLAEAGAAQISTSMPAGVLSLLETQHFCCEKDWPAQLLNQLYAARTIAPAHASKAR